MSEYKIMMHSGTLVDVLEPDPDTLLLEDIAYHLSHEPRFAGAIGTGYAVGHHSVVVAKLCSLMANAADPVSRARIIRAGLFHDGPEAALRDIPKDVKHAMRALSSRFNIGWNEEIASMVKKADEDALAAEVTALWPSHLQHHFNVAEPSATALAYVAGVRHLSAQAVEAAFVLSAASAAYGLSLGLLA